MAEKKPPAHKDILPEGVVHSAYPHQNIGGKEYAPNAAHTFSTMPEERQQEFVAGLVKGGMPVEEVMRIYGIPSETVAAFMEQQHLKESGRHITLTEENTHFIITDLMYAPPPGKHRITHSEEVEGFLQSVASLAGPQGKRYIQAAFENGTRVFEIVRKLARGNYRLEVVRQEDIVDDFSEEKSLSS